jgi:hypothetical protein
MKTIFLSLLSLFLFFGCNSSSDKSNSTTTADEKRLIFSLDVDKLHANTSSSYRVYDTKSSTYVDLQPWVYSDDISIAYFDSGRLYAQKSGKTTLNISYDGSLSRYELTVYDADVINIQASSDTYSLHKGFSSTLTCKALFSDGLIQDITNDVRWQSSDDNITNISSNRLIGVGRGEANVTAYFRNTSSYFNTKVLDAQMQRLVLSDEAVKVHENTSQQFHARAYFEDGTDEDITHDVIWGRTAPQIANIDANGFMRAYHYGKALIGASIGTFYSTIDVDVLKSDINSLDILLPEKDILLFRENNQSFSSYGCLHVMAKYDDGLKQLITDSIELKSSDETLLSIDNRGCYKTLKEGSVDIEATYKEITTSRKVKIEAVDLVDLQIYSPVRSLAEGLSSSIQSIGIDKNKNRYDLENESFWYSSNQNVLSVSNLSDSSGQILARKSGISTLSSQFGSLSASLDITVGTPALKALKFEPDINNTVAKGYHEMMHVFGYFIDGTKQELTQSVYFDSSNKYVATASNAFNKGELNTYMRGQSTISASYGAISTSFLLTVTAPEVVSLKILAPKPTMKRGETMNLNVFATYTDGRVVNFNNVAIWSTYPSYVATVLAGGVLSAENIGRVNVTASYGTISSAIAIDVLEPDINNIEIQEYAERVDVNQSIKLVAVGIYADGKRDDITKKVEWVSFDPTIASVVEGNVTGVSVGTAKIKIFYKGHTADKSIEVYRSEKELSIESTTNTINVGDDLKLESIVHYSDDNSDNVSTSTTWSSSDDTVLSVSSNGLIHGVSAGNADITAKYNDLETTLHITVQ